MSTRPADRLVAGRYALLERLGAGAMGTVWKAQDQLLERQVAIKEIAVPPGLADADRQAFEARVAREARAVSRLSHPAAVTMFDQIVQDGRTFLVMELVDAPTLAERVERDGPMAPARVAEIGLQVLGALRAAHHAGMVHRDVKPSNILVPDEGSAKLTDFGVVAVQDDPNVTATGMVLGSPNYMAPEQATGGALSPSTDMWGLGATLHFAVEGHPPFSRDSPIATVTAAVHDELVPPRRAGALRPVLERMLMKDSAQRLDEASAERELRAVATGAARMPTTVHAPEAPPAPPGPVDPTVAAEDHTEVVSTVPRRRAGTRGMLTALVVLVCLALIAAGTVWGMRRLSDRNATASSGAAGGSSTADDGAKATVPAGWRTLQRADAGFTVAYPPDWALSQSGSRTDLREPGTGTYLRLDWAPQATPSAVDAWRNLEASFKARYPDYQRVRLDPTTFHGSNNAAIWEYTYTDGGARLHAIDIGFVAAGHGYAFNFQTHADRWDASRKLREQLEAGFRTPSSSKPT